MHEIFKIFHEDNRRNILISSGGFFVEIFKECNINGFLIGMKIVFGKPKLKIPRKFCQ